MLSTKREPSAPCVPKLPLRHNTPGRSTLSAVLSVGSTPSTWTNVHNASRRFRMSRHVPSVLGTPQRLPTSKSRSISRCSGVIEERNVERCKEPSCPRCHHRRKTFVGVPRPCKPLLPWISYHVLEICMTIICRYFFPVLIVLAPPAISILGEKVSYGSQSRVIVMFASFWIIYIFLK